MGMHLKTAMNHKDRALRKLSELYWWLETSGMSSERLTHQYLEVMKTLSKCPQWVRSYVEGWSDAVRRRIEQKLVFFYTMPDGRLVSTHRDRDDYYEKLGIGPREVYEMATRSGHYWVVKRNTGDAIVEMQVPYFTTDMREEKGDRTIRIRRQP